MKIPLLLVTVLLIILTMCITGCTSPAASAPIQTPTPAPVVPRYHFGDVVAENYTDKIGLIILDYNQSLDQYSSRPILQKTDGSWAYYSPQHEMVKGNRSKFEKNLTNLVGHVSDPTTVKTMDLSNMPKDIAYLQELHRTQQAELEFTAISTPAEPVYSPPTRFSGHGDDVVSFTATGAGLRIFTMTHTGSSNFAIWLKDGDGKTVELLVNEIGSYSGKKSERLTSGTYYLDISADGTWTVEISS